MRIIYHTPLKGPSHRIPSGDRTMARALREMLRNAGHNIETIDRSRTSSSVLPQHMQWIGAQSSRFQYWRTTKAELWLTYHCYYKAPDWEGPKTARQLGLPYVLAEVSYAPKRAGGPWDIGHRQVAACIEAADLILNFNPIDANCVRPLMRKDAELLEVPPFILTKPYRAAAAARARHRAVLARRYKLPKGTPWLLTVAMMRPGDKLASYRILGQALAKLLDRPWRLLVVGTGEAKDEVRAALKPIARRVTYLGERSAEQLPAIYAASDLYVWPAINEAWGMTLLEAQASGLPVVAGRTGGVPNVVEDGKTGLLTPIGDVAAFAASVGQMLGAPERRAAMGRAAASYIAARHERAKVGRIVDAALQRAAARYKARP